MKIKTSELSGVALDWAVAQAIGVEVKLLKYSTGYCAYSDSLGEDLFDPSDDWAIGGPLIERFELEVICHSEGKWCAVKEWTFDVDCNYPEGETPLIAACRAIVAAKLGDEVDVPEGLV